jgi:hypothetical protein
MNIYKDVIFCLEKKGWQVSWIKDNQVSKNPYLRESHFWNRKSFNQYHKEVVTLWRQLLSTPQYSYPYDAFLAIDGSMVHPCLFETLQQRNPNVKKILFLYDNIDGHFQLDSFFKYYDKIFSFDMKDCNKYNLNLLPIYWVPSESNEKIKYDIFGLASLRYESQDRIVVFEKLKKMAKENTLREYIKLVYSTDQNKYYYAIKYIVLRILGKKCFTMRELRTNDLFAEKSINPDDFRKVIQQSKVILDTQNSYQDGLTARFMWALGLGKKIITTNENVKRYDFYNEKQMFVLKDNYNELLDFIKSPFEMDEIQRNLIADYRIDNWIDTLLGS